MTVSMFVQATRPLRFDRTGIHYAGYRTAYRQVAYVGHDLIAICHCVVHIIFGALQVASGTGRVGTERR